MRPSLHERQMMFDRPPRHAAPRTVLRLPWADRHVVGRGGGSSAGRLGGTRPRERTRRGQLLLWCARAQPEPHVLAEVTTLLGQDLDWDYVTRMAELNEITPLVVHTLRMCDPDLIPSCLSGRLDAQFYDNVARNLTLSSTLTALLDALAAQGIAAVPLKGPALAVMAYGDLSSRTFCDLDILVRRRDVERAEALLGRHGYRRRLDLAGLRDVAYRHSET